MMLGINQRIVLRILQEQLIEDDSLYNDDAIRMIEKVLQDNEIEVLRNE